MTLEVHELTPDRVGNYLAFFDHDAFSEFPWWSGCYCRFWDDPDDREGDSSPERRPRNRAIAEGLIREGRQSGMLAYADGKVVGWCNAKERSRYRAQRRIAQIAPDPNERVGSTVCFIVAPMHRGRGVASALLAAAVDKFRREGLEFAEGYPNTAPPSGPYASETPWSAHNSHGPLEMFLSAGFAVHRQLEHFAAVRLRL